MAIYGYLWLGMAIWLYMAIWPTLSGYAIQVDSCRLILFLLSSSCTTHIIVYLIWLLWAPISTVVSGKPRCPTATCMVHMVQSQSVLHGDDSSSKCSTATCRIYQVDPCSTVKIYHGISFSMYVHVSELNRSAISFSRICISHGLCRELEPRTRTSSTSKRKTKFPTTPWSSNVAIVGTCLTRMSVFAATTSLCN